MNKVLSFLGIILIAGLLTAQYVSDRQVIIIEGRPIFSNPDTSAGTVGTTPATGIVDRDPASARNYQRLIIQNTHALNNLCVFWVAAGAACGTSITCDGTGTDNGVLIRPDRAWSPIVAGDLRTCLVSDAAGTTFHISRAEVPEE